MKQFPKRLKDGWALVVTLLVSVTLLSCGFVDAGTEDEARQWMASIETKFNKICNSKVDVDWNLGINANEETKKKSVF